MSPRRSCISNCARARRRSIRRNISPGCERPALLRAAGDNEIKGNLGDLLRRPGDVARLTSDLTPGQRAESDTGADAGAESERRLWRSASGESGTCGEQSGEAESEDERAGLRTAGGKAEAL